MATRILVLILFILAVVTSSALSILYFDGGNAQGKVDKDSLRVALKDLIETEPEIIISGLRNAQVKKQQEEMEAAEKNITLLRSELEDGQSIFGNDDAKVTMVIFHDYSCGYCRKVVPEIKRLANSNAKDLRIILRDFPILGQLSIEKAKISIAFGKLYPESWFALYEEISNQGPKSVEQVYSIVESLGADAAKVKELASSSDVSDEINMNRSFADKIGIRGTPAFVVNGTLIKGAVGYDEFQSVINEIKGGL